MEVSIDALKPHSSWSEHAEFLFDSAHTPMTRPMSLALRICTDVCLRFASYSA